MTGISSAIARVSDQVGERDLVGHFASEVAVDDFAIDLQELRWDLTEAGCGWHIKRRFHVGHDAGPASPDHCVGC